MLKAPTLKLHPTEFFFFFFFCGLTFIFYMETYLSITIYRFSFERQELARI